MVVILVEEKRKMKVSKELLMRSGIPTLKTAIKGNAGTELLILILIGNG
jgi:hypothetical protein